MYSNLDMKLSTLQHKSIQRYIASVPYILFFLIFILIMWYALMLVPASILLPVKHGFPNKVVLSTIKVCLNFEIHLLWVKSIHLYAIFSVKWTRNTLYNKNRPFCLINKCHFAYLSLIIPDTMWVCIMYVHGKFSFLQSLNLSLHWNIFFWFD